MMKPRKSGGNSTGRDGKSAPGRQSEGARHGKPASRRQAEGTRPGKPSTRRQTEGARSGKPDERPKRRSSDQPKEWESSRPPQRNADERPRRKFSRPPEVHETERTKAVRSRDDDRTGPSERPYRKPGESRTISPSQKKTVRFTDDDERPRRKRVENKPTGRGFEGNRQKSDGYRGRKEESPREKRMGRAPARETKRTSSPANRDGNPGEIRLNKYIADAGICSRREADDLIESGAVKVNGEIVSQLGSKVYATDKVQIGDQTLSRETLRYVLLNKPKGYITTLEDPEGRKTVMFLIRDACRERIYPVGRLDRNTTGVLLFTNDGELAKKLTHPKYGIRKMYHVVLDQPLTHEHMRAIEEGLELEDGFIKVDAIAYVGDGKDRRQLGVEIHSGKNRIVRRIFEELGYTINTLDRVIFAGLTKKDLPRGRWRNLSDDEVNFLKMQG